MFDFIPRFFERLSKRKFNQEQTECLLDIITCVMVADGVTTQEEREQLERALDGLSWEGGGTAAEYVERAETRLKEADARTEFLSRAATVINDPDLQDEVYFLAARMAGADDRLVLEETAVLHDITRAFGLDGERLRLITQRLRHEGHV
jgi:uncharacterized tellurite resistance protein B-like protein